MYLKKNDEFNTKPAYFFNSKIRGEKKYQTGLPLFKICETRLWQCLRLSWFCINHHIGRYVKTINYWRHDSSFVNHYWLAMILWNTGTCVFCLKKLNKNLIQERKRKKLKQIKTYISSLFFKILFSSVTAFITFAEL